MIFFFKIQTLQTNDKESSVPSYERLLASIIVAYGGYVAEEERFGKAVTAGIESDLKYATEIGLLLVKSYGFREAIGKESPRHYYVEGEELPERSKNIERELKLVLDYCYKWAQSTYRDKKYTVRIINDDEDY